MIRSNKNLQLSIRGSWQTESRPVTIKLWIKPIIVNYKRLGSVCSVVSNMQIAHIKSISLMQCHHYCCTHCHSDSTHKVCQPLETWFKMSSMLLSPPHPVSLNHGLPIYDHFTFRSFKTNRHWGQLFPGNRFPLTDVEPRVGSLCTGKWSLRCRLYRLQTQVTPGSAWLDLVLWQ